MPLPPFQTDPRTQKLPPELAMHPVGFVQGSPAVLLVTSLQQIPAALAQGKPVLIDIPAVQWRLSLLATIQEWGGSLGWWLVKLLATFLLTQWLSAQGLLRPGLGEIQFSAAT
jgi:hypothetical protein